MRSIRIGNSLCCIICWYPGQGSFLVFARTKHGAERLAKKLWPSGVKATAIHGDRSQNQRNQALRGFQEGQYRVLVATDVAARGIHVETSRTS